jgi:hypothetical protein
MLPARGFEQLLPHCTCAFSIECCVDAGNLALFMGCGASIVTEGSALAHQTTAKGELADASQFAADSEALTATNAHHGLKFVTEACPIRNMLLYWALMAKALYLQQPFRITRTSNPQPLLRASATPSTPMEQRKLCVKQPPFHTRQRLPGSNHPQFVQQLPLHTISKFHSSTCACSLPHKTTSPRSLLS